MSLIVSKQSTYPKPRDMVDILLSWIVNSAAAKQKCTNDNLYSKLS